MHKLLNNYENNTSKQKHNFLSPLNGTKNRKGIPISKTLTKTITAFMHCSGS